MTETTLRREAKAKRGCGYRKAGALYLVSDGPAHECGLLPRELTVCPCCNAGVHQKIGWSWAQARMVLRAEDVHGCGQGCDALCGMRGMAHDLERKMGLIWVGAKYYPTPADFVREGLEMGISRRVAAVPKGFLLGETWVLLAHPLAIECLLCVGGKVNAIEPGAEPVDCEACRAKGKRAGVFGLFRPTRIEQIITETQSRDPELLERLGKRGITPVVVADGDPDHIPGEAAGDSEDGTENEA